MNFWMSVGRQNVLQHQHLDQHHLVDHQMHHVAGPGMDPGVVPGAPHPPNGGDGMKVRCTVTELYSGARFHPSTAGLNVVD